MWAWKILRNHHLGFQPGCRLTKGPDQNYSKETYWQKILVSESEPLHPGNGEVQHILTATKMTGAVVFQLEVWGCVLWPWKKKEHVIETRNTKPERRVGASRLTAGRVRCLKPLKRKSQPSISLGEKLVRTTGEKVESWRNEDESDWWSSIYGQLAYWRPEKVLIGGQHWSWHCK